MFETLESRRMMSASGFGGGVRVAAGDVNGDGVSQISVTNPQPVVTTSAVHVSSPSPQPVNGIIGVLIGL